MRKYGIYLAVAGVSVCLIALGVKFSGSSHGGIGVVDLDKVAAETGKSVEIRDALNRVGEVYRAEILDFRNKAQVALNAKNEKLSEKIKESEKVKEDEIVDKKSLEKDRIELAQQLQAVNNTLAQAQNTAGTKLNQLAQMQAARFRNELKPIVQEIAAKHGLSVVIPKNEGLLLAVQPGADITDEVTKAYQKRPVQAAPAQQSAPAQQPAASSAAQPAQTAAAAKPQKPLEKATEDDSALAAPAAKEEKKPAKAKTEKTANRNVSRPSDSDDEGSRN